MGGASVSIPSIIALVLLLVIAGRALYLNFERFRPRKQSGFDETGYEPIDDDILADIAWYHHEKLEAHPNPSAVDDITWADLDMDAVYAYLNRTRSVVGEEVLYSMLHEIDAPDNALSRRRELIDAFSRDENVRDTVAALLKKIGKDHFHGLVAYLFYPRFKSPGRFPLYVCLGLLPLVSLLLCIVHPAFLFLFLAAFFANITVHFTSGKVWKNEIKAISHLYTVVRCARKLVKANLPELREETEELKRLLPGLKSLSRWGSLFLMERVGDLDFITDYIKILFQLNMISLCKVASHLSAHTEEINQLYALIGEIDAMLAISSLRAADSRFSHPSFRRRGISKWSICVIRSSKTRCRIRWSGVKTC